MSGRILRVSSEIQDYDSHAIVHRPIEIGPPKRFYCRGEKDFSKYASVGDLWRLFKKNKDYVNGFASNPKQSTPLSTFIIMGESERGYSSDEVIIGPTINFGSGDKGKYDIKGGHRIYPEIDCLPIKRISGRFMNVDPISGLPTNVSLDSPETDEYTPSPR